MHTITAKLPRFAPMHGWANRILRVDLSDGRIWAQETAPKVPDFLGARGLAAKIVWDEYPEPVPAFDPRNPFMIVPGALTGAPSPYSGRTNVCAFSPQSHPYEWFTRASIGGYFGDELKKAGYDGLVVTGASETPVRIRIRDDEVSIVPADEMWGMDALAVQDAIEASDGKSVRTATIGPAGENLSRIATVHTGSTSVAGQGGFGAVMGSKKLKAISVIGSGKVTVADPDGLRKLYRGVAAQMRGMRGRWYDLEQLNAELQKEGGGRARLGSCTAHCPTPCRLEVSDVQGCHFHRKWSGGLACVSMLFGGGAAWNYLYDWDLGFRGGFEMNMHANRLGLNHWDILVAMALWMRHSEGQGLLAEINGRALEWNSCDFWTDLLDDIAYRRGVGDVLAEGTYRAALQLDMAVDVMRRHFTGWGYAGHWDGHGDMLNTLVFPFWLVGALQWAMDTRDPASSTHGYVQSLMWYGPLGETYRNPDVPITWDHMKAIGERVYGSPDALDPLSGYAGKASPAAYHAVRSVMKDCLPTDDQVFPLIYSHKTEDRFCRIDGIDGPDVDAALFRAGTGIDWDPKEFARAAERVVNLERANVVRHWARDRQMDERVLPSFEYDENWINPEIGERKSLDRDAFAPVLDEYYRLRGWDVASGWPTRAKLEGLGLGDVYSPMVAGAGEAQSQLEELPEEGPVADPYRCGPDRPDRAGECWGEGAPQR